MNFHFLFLFNNVLIFNLFILNSESFQIFNIQVMYGNRGTRPCRYGPSCRFLARGDCWFYHPDWHQTHTFVNTSYRQPQTSSRVRLSNYRNSSFYGEQSDQEEDNFFNFRTTQSRSSRSSNVEPYNHNQLLRLLSILTLQAKSKKQEVQKKSEPVNVIEKGKKVLVGKKMMNQVKIECKLQKSKSWYFQNCCHFQYEAGCLYEECAICLNKFQSKQIVSELLCNHAFHTDCIQQWLKKSDNCPLCREDFKNNQKFKKMPGYVLRPKLFSFNSMSTRSLLLRQ